MPRSSGKRAWQCIIHGLNDQLDIFLQLWLVILMKIITYPCNAPIISAFISKGFTGDKNYSFPETVQACLNSAKPVNSDA
jgi:hypothetical protein